MRAYPVPELTEKQIKKFWAKVGRSTENHCWLWKGAVRQDGYGAWAPSAKLSGAKPHRVAWKLLRGQIPDGLTLDHLCMNKLCCNPTHLEPVTQSENTKRYMATKPLNLFCINGHAKQFGIPCNICIVENARRWRKNNIERARANNRASYRKIGKQTRHKLKESRK